MRLAFRIALRFLTTSKGQTLLIAFGIAIGISVQIFIGSLIEGLQISLLDTTIGSASHITVLADEKNAPIDDYASIIADIETSYSDVIHVSPSITRGAFVSFDEKTTQIIFRGFEFDRADNIYKLSKALLPNSRLPEVGTNEILLGKKLSEDFNISIGDTVDVVTSATNFWPAVVVGTFDLKVSAINESWVVGNLSFAKEAFYFEPNQAISIEMQTKVPFDADLIAADMSKNIARDGVKFENWKAQNEQLLSGLSGQSSSSLMIQVFVVISVVLGIASVLAITVLQKSRQIGILKAMGINDTTSSLVFLFQGFILGIIGGILGIVIGLGLLVVFSTFALNPDGTPVVPIFINYRFMLLSGAIAIVASTSAAIIPALKSSKLSPIEVIKNG
jgi:lipoprotein-releasing system permease protein